jgi:hypothetical protein
MKRKQTSPKDLSKMEWAFLDCPKDEIADCWLYEFSRELGWLKDLVERRRGRVTLKTGHQVSLAETLTGFARQSGYSFLVRPDWPAQPYLAAQPKERKKWNAWTRLQTQQELLANHLMAFEVPAGIEQELAYSLRDLGRPRVRSKDNFVELALIRINWAMPDSLLKQAWNSYIKEFRPKILPNRPLSGKTSLDSKWLRQLEKLGRYRLVRANNDSVALARATGHLKTGKADPWYRAVKTVEELLENGETEIVPLLSREALAIGKGKGAPL